MERQPLPRAEKSTARALARRRTVLGVATALGCSALAGNALAFTWIHATPLVQMDGWRHVQLYLVPLARGEWSWRLLWSDHHPQPVNALLFVLNARWFDLRMDYEALLGVGFAVVLTALLFLEYRRSTASCAAGLEARNLAFLGLAVVALGTKVPMPFVSSLVSLTFLPGVAVLAAFALFDRCISRPGGGHSLVRLGVAYFALLSLFPEPLLLAAGPMAVGLLVALATGGPRGRVLRASGTLALAVALHQLLLGGAGRYGVGGVSRLLSLLGAHGLESLRYVETGVASGFFNLRWLARAAGDPADVEVFIHLGAALHLLGAALFFVGRRWTSSTVPLLLMLFPLAVLGAALAYRFQPDLQDHLAADVSRYHAMVLPGAIGAVWMFVLELLDPGKTARVLRVGLAGTGLAVVVSSQLFFVREAWRASPVLLRYTADSEARIRDFAAGRRTAIPPDIAGYNFPEPFTSSLGFLRDQQLNLFSPSWRDGRGR